MNQQLFSKILIPTIEWREKMKGKRLSTECRKMSAEVIFRSLVLLVLVIPMFAGVTPAGAAEGDFEWVQTIATEHTRPADTSFGFTTVAPDGSVYLLGNTDGVMDNQTQVGYSDIFLQKYNPEGGLVWVRQFGSTHGDWPVEVAADSSGVYIAGNTYGAFEGHTNPDMQTDGIVLKYDPDGNLLWSEEIGTNYQTFVKGIAITLNSLYVTGWTYGTFDDPDAASHSADAYLRKYSLDGALQWARTYATELIDQADGVAADESGAYVAGYYGNSRNLKKVSPEGEVLWSNDWLVDTLGNVQIYNVEVAGSKVYLAGSTYSALPGETKVGEWDVYIVTFDSVNGALGWLHQFGTPTGDFFSSLVADSSGVTLGGTTNGALGGENAGYIDGFLRKYTSEGNEAWTFQFGSEGNDYLFGIDVDATGIYAVGITTGNLDGQTGSSGEEIFIKKVDLSLNSLWTNQFNTTSYIPENEYGYVVDTYGENVYLGGYIRINSETTVTTSTHAYLAKYSSIGDRQWMDIIIPDPIPPSSTSYADATSLVTDEQGNVYLAGNLNGVLPGQTGYGYGDAYLRKYAPDGTVLWTRQFGTDQNDRASRVVIYGDVIYVAGSTSGQAGAISYGLHDVYIRQFSPAGDPLGAIEQFGSPQTDYATSLVVDESGIYLGGYTLGSLEGFTNAGSYDAFLRKYNPDGSLAWTRQFGTDNSDDIVDMTIDGDNIFITGNTSGSLDGQGNLGGSDVFIGKFSLNGDEQWFRQTGTAKYDYATGIAAGSSDLYMPWYTLQGPDGSPQAFLDKYNSNGEQISSRIIDKQTELGGVRGIAIDGHALYIAGSVAVLDHFISADAALLKISLGGNNSPVVGEITAPAAPVAVNSIVNASASFTDADPSDTHTAVWSWGDGTTSAGTVSESGGSGTVTGSHVYTDAGDYQLTLTVTDAAQMEGSANYQYVVVYDPGNTAPTANPGGPYLGAINTAISFDGTLSSDPDSDPLTYAWSFGNGGAGTGATPAHSYTAAGIYDVCLTVNDGTDYSDPACTLAVVYDPSAGFVTGGGWIDSPAGAYKVNAGLSGKATFGFVSKYQKNTSVPAGNTAFQFEVGGFEFSSTAYEWLVVNKSGTNAQFKGSGLVNGELASNGSAYKFMLWAGDGLSTNSADTFRIRIWWEDAAGEHDVYDNGVDQPIGGGSIVVHTKK
jgi:PKD repeat protein